MSKMPGWNEIPIGGLIVEAGNAEKYLTGGWRAFRPVVEMDKCTNCMMCWLYCPDVSITVKEATFLGFDLNHCKGCGICAKVCPVGCIKMVEEGKFA